MRQAGVHGPRLIAGIPEFIARLVDHQRQALAAILRVAGQCGPTAVDKLLIGRFKARGRGHSVRGGVERAAFAVAALIQREDHLGGKLAALFQNRHDGVDVVVSMRRQRGEFSRNVKQLLHDKTHVAKRGGVSRHGESSFVKSSERLKNSFVYRAVWRPSSALLALHHGKRNPEMRRQNRQTQTTVRIVTVSDQKIPFETVKNGSLETLLYAE